MLIAVRGQAMPVAKERLAAVNILNAPAPAGTLGKTEVVCKQQLGDNVRGLAQNCAVGDILFSDGTCASDVVSGKTPIAVVVYISDEGCGQALALESVGSYLWGGYGTDISDLTNYMAEHEAEQDYASCKNSQIIMAAGDKNTYPAVWAANEYSTEGTRAGDWCLPAAGIFSSYRYNQTSINISFKKINGTQFATNTFAWSSSEYKLTVAWYSDFNSTYGIRTNEKNYSHEVRPVIEF